MPSIIPRHAAKSQYQLRPAGMTHEAMAEEKKIRLEERDVQQPLMESLSLLNVTKYEASTLHDEELARIGE
jgi:hypothetical protein